MSDTFDNSAHRLPELSDMIHTCHAIGCKKTCKPEFLMCTAHWKKVPPHLHALVYKHYRVGQCDDKDVTKEWLDAADRAIQGRRS